MGPARQKYLARLLALAACGFVSGSIFGCAKSTPNSPTVSHPLDQKSAEAITQMDSIRHDLAVNDGIVISLLDTTPLHDVIEIANLSYSDLITARAELDGFIQLGEGVLAQEKQNNADPSTQHLIQSGVLDSKEWERVIDLRLQGNSGTAPSDMPIDTPVDQPVGIIDTPTS